ncbi:MAG: hypothetical protein ACK5MH_09105 [Bacteroidales bacterium]
MAINYKDIEELNDRGTPNGDEKIEISADEYLELSQIKQWMLDVGGNNLRNAGFEVVTSLPTTNNFVGRRVTYQGGHYIWSGSIWNSLALYVQDFPLTKRYILFDSSSAAGWKAGSGLIFTQYQRYGTNAFGVYNSYDCMELFECSYTTPNKTDIDEGVVYPNPINQAKISKRNIWTDSPDVLKYKHKLTEGIFGSIGTFPANTNLSTWLNTTSNGVAGYNLKNCTSIFTDLFGGMAYYLNLTQIVSNMKMGMNYTFVGRAIGAGVVMFEVVDSRGSASTNFTIDTIVSFDFVRISTGIVLYRNFEVR